MFSSLNRSGFYLHQSPHKKQVYKFVLLWSEFFRCRAHLLLLCLKCSCVQLNLSWQCMTFVRSSHTCSRVLLVFHHHRFVKLKKWCSQGCLETCKLFPVPLSTFSNSLCVFGLDIYYATSMNCDVLSFSSDGLVPKCLVIHIMTVFMTGSRSVTLRCECLHS